MFTLLKTLSRSRKSPSPAPAHRPAFEPLEGRRLHSATPVAADSFSSGDTQQGLLLPAIQAAREARSTTTNSGGYLLTSIEHSGGVNTNGIIAILIGL